MGCITDVHGIKAGHATDETGRTGCSVVLCEAGAVAGVDVRGGSPGTRETDLCRPGHMVERLNAVLLTGGSAFGLSAADGVMRYLEERDRGVDTGFATVPIVPAAVIFDLGVGDPKARPNADMGYAAAKAASTDELSRGQVGAGTGATVGKALGMSSAMPGGVGSASVRGGGACVGALIVVNALGDVVNPESDEIIAGAKHSVSGEFLNTKELMLAAPLQAAATNTVIGVVATDAILSREQANRLASIAHNGLARTISPAHTMYDGDTLFALSTLEREAPFDVLLVAAVRAVELAVLSAFA